MKNFKEWGTTTIGMLFMVLSGYMFYLEKPVTYGVIVFTLGFGGLFMRDTLLKKLVGKV